VWKRQFSSILQITNITFQFWLVLQPRSAIPAIAWPSFSSKTVYFAADLHSLRGCHDELESNTVKVIGDYKLR